jgi:transcriptional antiterminator NusG
MDEAMLEPFIVGETIRIIDGPFNDFVGDIKEVNEEKKKLKVIVKILVAEPKLNLTLSK